jgi:hypothetical protein
MNQLPPRFVGAPSSLFTGIQNLVRRFVPKPALTRAATATTFPRDLVWLGGDLWTIQGRRGGPPTYSPSTGQVWQQQGNRHWYLVSRTIPNVVVPRYPGNPTSAQPQGGQFLGSSGNVPVVFDLTTAQWRPV